MSKHLLNRRQFSARFMAFGLSLPTLSGMIAAQEIARVPGTGAAGESIMALRTFQWVQVYVRSRESSR